MKNTDFMVYFTTGQFELTSAMGIQVAIILAQAEQIKKGNEYSVFKVINLETKEVFYI